MKYLVEESVGIVIAQIYIFRRFHLLSLMVRHPSPMCRLLIYISSPLLSHFPSPSPPFLRFVDDETAEFLSSALPSGSQVNVDKIKEALEDTRRRMPPPSSTLETRVTEALASLGLR